MRSRVLLVLPLLAAVAATQPPTGPSLIILNARVFTGVPATPWVEALSVAGERIGVVGATEAVRALATASTRVIDAGERLVVPGLNDAHIHLGGLPAHVRLAGPPAMEHDPPLDEMLERLKAAVRKASNDAWVFGEIAARVLDDPAATRFALDAVAPDVPVALTAWTGHGTLFNTAALRVLGVRNDEPDPPGGVFERMPGTRTVSGKAHEYAQYILFQRLSGRVTAESHVAALRAVAAQAGGWGITSLQVMANGESVPALAKIVAAAGVEQRIRLIEFPMDGMTAWRARGRDAAADGVVVSGTKWILDGTPVERLMFLREPYSDRQSTRGALNFQPREIDGFLRRALAAREQPMFHAVGDAAIDAVLAALERTGGDAWQPLRPRLEHGDMLEPGHYARARRTGLVLVQNPSHFMIPALMNERLGPRASRATMMRSALAAGIPLALGSDGPLNPFLNMMFAVTNANNPGEAMTREQVLAAYTSGAAYAEFADMQKGTLSPGMLADLAVLSQDIFTVPTVALPETTSVLTVAGGRVLFETRQDLTAPAR